MFSSIGVGFRAQLFIVGVHITYIYKVVRYIDVHEVVFRYHKYIVRVGFYFE